MCRTSGPCARSASIGRVGAPSGCNCPIGSACGCAPIMPAQLFRPACGGRDFVRTLAGVWQANDCLTAARNRALAAHLERLAQPPPQRPRPGSYSWPELRRNIERRYATGATPAALTATVHTAFADCPARPPSRRTIQRWHAQRRWLAHAP